MELPGERKLKTNTILSIGEHSVRVEAFVCRKPDENHEGVYRFLLKRNRRLYGVAYTLDNVGDIYLVGRMSLASVDADEIDRVLGQVLEAVDSDFNTLLELGFRSSIQKEWEWRVSRGESLKNLEAFAHLIDDDDEQRRLTRVREILAGMGDTATLVLLRHGESDWNALNLFTGWVDVGLTEKGRAEAVRSGELLAEHDLLPDVLYTSLLRRAITTAHLALDSRRPAVDPRAPQLAAQRTPLRRAAGPGQGRDQGALRRRAVHGLAAQLRHAATADREGQRVQPGRRPALRRHRRRPADRVPGRRGGPVSAVLHRRDRPGSAVRQDGADRRARQLACAPWSSTWTRCPTTRSPS